MTASASVAPAHEAGAPPSFVLAGSLVGLGAGLVGPMLGGGHTWVAHLPHDMMIALPGALILGMMLGPRDWRDLARMTMASLFGVAASVALLLVAGLH